MWTASVNLFTSSIDLISILMLLFSSSFCSCSSKKRKALSAQIKSEWNLAESSSSKYKSTDGVRFSIWHHTFKMAAMTSFHATKCCHLVSEHKESASIYSAATISSWSIVHSYLLSFSSELSSHICKTQQSIGRTKTNATILVQTIIQWNVITLAMFFTLPSVTRANT